MSYLALALTSALDALHWNQSDVAKLAKLNAGQINRAVRGNVATGVTTVQKIVAIMPPAHQGAILAGWLRDQLDAQFLSMVEIYPAGKSIAAEEPALPQLPRELDTESRELILWLADQATRHVAVRDAIRSLKRAAQSITTAR